MLSLKALLIPALLLANGMSFGQSPNSTLLSQPKIDKRIELVSIAFRLADYPEYNFEENKKYISDIHQHFDQYTDHALISFLRRLRDSSDARFDAVMAMAVHLSQPPALKPVVPFTLNVPDDRWESPNHYKDTFVILLQRFYVDSKFEEFFAKERNLYNVAEQRYRVVFDSLDANWYRNFYGNVPAGRFHTTIGFGNGRGNYGLKVKHPDQTEEIYAVVGTWRTDSLGLPVYTVKNNLPTLIHEFNHSFINYLNTKYKKDLEQAGRRLYKEVSTEMEEQGYPDWKIMLDEALVRAAVIKYIKAHSTDNRWANNELGDELNNGFVWIKELVALLDEYEQNKKQYPTLEQFMPRLIDFYNKTADNLSAVRDNYERSRPHVVSIEPFKNEATNVEPTITEIKIVFDKPLTGVGFVINNGSKGKEHNPISSVSGYTDNNTALRLNIKLEPGKEYQFILSGRGFRTPEGYTLNDYEVNFTTSK